jgi:putative hydrolase of the HAD superfamily
MLNDIKKSNLKTGILTDVPYGRKGFIKKDIMLINIPINAVLSSVNVGYRKPNITGYKLLAEKLEVQFS